MPICQFEREEAVVQWLCAGIELNKINLISPGCPRPSIALQCEKSWPKYHSFYFLYLPPNFQFRDGDLAINSCTVCMFNT